MFHVEMRQFPHNFCSFNIGDDELRAIVDPWIRDRPVDFGERRWSPLEARLKILEGPELTLQQLSMGRGWQAAQRVSEDVTERVLDSARQWAANAAAPALAAPAAAAGIGDPLAFGFQIASLLGSDPTRLLEAWWAAAADSRGLAPSETLALAEHKLASPQ
jgi:hypothetical protein